jgi:hypothetical protein
MSMYIQTGSEKGVKIVFGLRILLGLACSMCIPLNSYGIVKSMANSRS